MLVFYLKIENEPARAVLRMNFPKCHLSKLPMPSDNVVAYLLSLGLAMNLKVRDVVAMLSTCKQLNALMDYLTVTGTVPYEMAFVPRRPTFTRFHADMKSLQVYRGCLAEVPSEVSSLTVSGATLVPLSVLGQYLQLPDSPEIAGFVQGAELDTTIRSVTKLEIVGCAVDDLHILEYFPNLRKLTLRDVSGGEDYDIHSDYGNGPYQLLSSPVDLSKLVKLNVDHCVEFDYEVLLRSAPNLKKISVVDSEICGLVHEGVTKVHCVDCKNQCFGGLANLRSCRWITSGALEEDFAEYLPILRELYITAGSSPENFVPPSNFEVFELKIIG